MEYVVIENRQDITGATGHKEEWTADSLSTEALHKYMESETAGAVIDRKHWEGWRGSTVWKVAFKCEALSPVSSLTDLCKEAGCDGTHLQP